MARPWAETNIICYSPEKQISFLTFFLPVSQAWAHGHGRSAVGWSMVVKRLCEKLREETLGDNKVLRWYLDVVNRVGNRFVHENPETAFRER